MLRLPKNYDWKNPDTARVFHERVQLLNKLRSDPAMLADLKAFYALPENAAQFITDWGVTSDPREIEVGRSAILPFVLFPKQEEWLQWVVQRWRAREPGLTEKSRECGISWLAVSLSCVLSLHHKNMTIGFGSRKEEYVDKLGAPKSLFYKTRLFMQYLPKEFRGGWELAKHAPHMRIEFPNTGSVITGEAGDNIGRGDRAALYFVDEAAHLERPELVEASLSATTNCRQDISSVAGSANPFAIKRHSGKIKVFTFPWQDDPRKDQAWYEKKCNELDEVTVAQEIDMNYQASVEGVVIPAQWVNAALDAHKRLGIRITGLKSGALDVADEGKDRNAFAVRHGNLLTHAESWSGKGSDTFETAERAFFLCDTNGLSGFDYDADGIGASIRGDSRVINERRHASKPRIAQLLVNSFRGSAAVTDPEHKVPGTDRTNEDFYENFKAQSWWELRRRFQATFRATQGKPYNPDDIISISSDFSERAKLMIELSQPVYLLSKSGKVMIDKTPDGVSSPNLADAVMMLFSPKRPPMVISDAALQAFRSPIHVNSR